MSLLTCPLALARSDVDEAVCRSQRRGAAGVQLCPENGHVLYLDVGADVRGPTCVWEEERDGETERGGAPRLLTELHVVPARVGRLLRFRGDMLHAVPKPACEWVDTGGGVGMADARRCVILFNTWDVPPTLPPPDAPASPKAVDSLKALGFTPGCLPLEAWTEVESTVDSAEAEVRSGRVTDLVAGTSHEQHPHLWNDWARSLCLDEDTHLLLAARRAKWSTLWHPSSAIKSGEAARANPSRRAHPRRRYTTRCSPRKL